MHAVVTNAEVVQSHTESALKALREEIVPRVSKSPGFVKGYWTRDGQRGVSLVVFKTKEDAENAVKALRSNPVPTGVTIISAEVREVVAEA